jgi:hypothetical protein
MKKAKVELIAEAVSKVIEDGKFCSLTGLAHSLGYKGSVSSSLTRKLRELLPDIDSLLAANKPAQDGKTDASAGKASKATKEKPAKPKSSAKATGKSSGGKWPRHPANNFREGSSYGTCFDVLAAHPDGLSREKLVEMLAKASGKDIQHAAFDAQVVCSARKNDVGLNAFEGPRNRSCKHGFYVERTNGHVKLVLPAAGSATKETP